MFSQVSGIGKVSEKMLNALDISSCSHLGQQMALLSLLFSETAWHHFMQVSFGLGSTYILRYLTHHLMKVRRNCEIKQQNNYVQTEEIILTSLLSYRHEERKSMSTERYYFSLSIKRRIFFFFFASLNFLLYSLCSTRFLHFTGHLKN